MLYALALLAVVAVILLAIYLNADRAVIRARHRYRRSMADKVLKLASLLEGFQLWVAMPFPELVLDAKQFPEAWADRARHWQRVVGREGSALLLEAQSSVEALGCDWYLYADENGRVIDKGIASLDESDMQQLPPGIDPESLRPPDDLLGGDTSPGGK